MRSSLFFHFLYFSSMIYFTGWIQSFISDNIQAMARIVQGLRCMVNQSFMAARVAGPRNIFQHRSMHYGLSSTTGGLIALSLVKTVQVKNQFQKSIMTTWLAKFKNFNYCFDFILIRYVFVGAFKYMMDFVHILSGFFLFVCLQDQTYQAILSLIVCVN